MQGPVGVSWISDSSKTLSSSAGERKNIVTLDRMQFLEWKAVYVTKPQLVSTKLELQNEVCKKIRIPGLTLSFLLHLKLRSETNEKWVTVQQKHNKAFTILSFSSLLIIIKILLIEEIH